MRSRSLLSSLAPALIALLLVRVPDPPDPALTHGPLLGAVSDHSIRIWTRLDREGRVRVRLWPGGRPGAARAYTAKLADERDDFTSVVTIGGLRPSTRYDYALEIGSADGGRWKPLARREPQRFTTLRAAGTRGKLRLVVSADIDDHDKSKGLKQMRKLAPDFALLLGDNVYMKGAAPLMAMRERYREGWAGRAMRAMMTEVPTFMIWDDHDIRDNYWKGRADARYVRARKAYEEYQNSHNPEPLRKGELYYTIVAGDVEIFVLDTRTFRDARDVVDDPSKTMLGAEQKRALLHWLRTSPARFKVIASSVMVSRFATTSYDSWNGFSAERTQILDAIVDAHAKPLLFLTGDQHWNALIRFDHRHGAAQQRFYELQPTPLAADHRVAPRIRSGEFLARDDDHDVFGVVDVDTTGDAPRVTLTMCAADLRCRPGRERPPRSPLELEGKSETVPWTVTLTAADFEVPASKTGEL